MAQIKERYERVRAISAKSKPGASTSVGNCSISAISEAGLFSNPSLIKRESENKRSRMRKEAKEKAKKISGAEKRTVVRLAKHPSKEWEVMSVRELADHFPCMLGKSITNHSNTEYTKTNKIVFKNKDTGWHVCHDKFGCYNTVLNELGHYVALDGTTSKQGTDKKFHFRNVEQSSGELTAIASPGPTPR